MVAVVTKQMESQQKLAQEVFHSSIFHTIVQTNIFAFGEKKKCCVWRTVFSW